MRGSCEGFACVECGGGMEEVESVPVLQSLQDHVIYRCAACGHILLVPENTGDRSLGWLKSAHCVGTISCAALV